MLDNLKPNGSEFQSKFMQGVTAGKLSKLLVGQATLNFWPESSSTRCVKVAKGMGGHVYAVMST